MIAKRTPRRRDSQSSFKELARYILDLKNEGRKAAAVLITNCLGDTASLAVKEIEATQALNRRSRIDKTYHLILSFRSGETPTAAQLADIEEVVCQAIGLGAHQRLSVVHNDTDNLHVHLAINKVHPESFNCIEPYYDHFRLDEVCREMELKHGLEVDNRIEREERPMGKPGDMEAHSGVISFDSWVKGAPAAALEEVLAGPGVGWAEVQAVLARFNLCVRKRGAGFVIADRDRPLFVKSSAVLREASKNGLESRLGTFMPADVRTFADTRTQTIKAETQYEKVPLHRDAASDALYRRYGEEKTAVKRAKEAALAALRAEREGRFEVLKAGFRERSLEIRLSGLGRRARARLYGGLAEERKASTAALGAEFKAARQVLYDAHRAKTWQGFLIDEALQGNEVALRVLRSRPTKTLKGYGGGILSGVERDIIIYNDTQKEVRKNGDVVYRFRDGGLVRDEGERLRIEGTARETLFAALQMGIQKYGKALDIDGTEDFKRELLAISGELGLPVKFNDLAMERVRGALDKRPSRSRIGEDKNIS